MKYSLYHKLKHVKTSSNILTLILAFYSEILLKIFFYFAVERFCSAIGVLHLVIFACLSFKMFVCSGKYIKAV